jgi:RNA polymerase sigma-70 factor, ECF subfamily
MTAGYGLRPAQSTLRAARPSARIADGTGKIGRTIRAPLTSGWASTREGHLELVARAAKGDRDAFDELVDLHVADLHRLALVVAGPNRAEDVTQDAFLRAWRDLPRLRDADRFVPWLRRILVNVARDGQRGDRRRVRPTSLASAADVTEQRAGHGDPAAEIDRATDLHRVLSLLTVEQRAVVGLHYLADLTLPDVALTLGIPVGTAKSRLNAGLIVLRRRLGEDRP